MHVCQGSNRPLTTVPQEHLPTDGLWTYFGWQVPSVPRLCLPRLSHANQHPPPKLSARKHLFANWQINLERLRMMLLPTHIPALHDIPLHRASPITRYKPYWPWCCILHRAPIPSMPARHSSILRLFPCCRWFVWYSIIPGWFLPQNPSFWLEILSYHIYLTYSVSTVKDSTPRPTSRLASIFDSGSAFGFVTK